MEQRSHDRDNVIDKLADPVYKLEREQEAQASMSKVGDVTVGEQSVTVDKPKTEPGYCGFTFSDILSNHCCNDCGKLAEGMLKKWDAGVLVWARYACAKCANKHVAKYTEQVSQ